MSDVISVEIEIRPEAAKANTDMATQTSTPGFNMAGWQVLPVKTRVDAFSQDALKQEMRQIRAQGCKRIALDLKANRFFSVQAIHACVEIARELADEGGCLALVGPSERSKKHFETYGSLKQIWIVRSEKDLERPPRQFPFSADPEL